MSAIRQWKELEKKTIFKKYSHNIESIDFRLPDGTISDFVIDSRHGAACTLGLTPDNQVVLVKQYRPGPRQILDELPGGHIEKHETGVVAARREFIEETGFDGDFESVGRCLDDAYSTLDRYCFIAKNCKKIGNPQNTSTEQTEVVLVSLDAFREILRSGRMTDVEVGYLCLDYLGLL
jgi:ADP-ribose pyrophosphatase